MTDWYFAYGSNMNPERMKARGLSFVAADVGRLNGFKLSFNKKAAGKQNVAYANIVYARKDCVEGVLYRLNSENCIKQMDVFEGTPVRYSREIFTVTSSTMDIDAWVYIANPLMIEDGLLPERRYMQHLIAGKQWLSEEYYNSLLNQPVIDPDYSEPNNYVGDDGLKFNV